MVVSGHFWENGRSDSSKLSCSEFRGSIRFFWCPTKLYYGPWQVKMSSRLKCLSSKFLSLFRIFSLFEASNLFYTEKSVYSSFPEVHDMRRPVFEVLDHGVSAYFFLDFGHAWMTARFFWTSQNPIQFSFLNIFKILVVGLGILK